MRIVNHKPFWWGLMFPEVDFEMIEAFTWGSTIYTPRVIPRETILHEQVHIKQQRGSKILGALMMLRAQFDRKFAFGIELEAYQEQVAAGGDKHKAAMALSSPFYGFDVTYEEVYLLL